MRTWRGIGIISTTRSTRLWDCRLGVGWSRVRVSGSSNSASREWEWAGVRLDLTICYISIITGEKLVQNHRLKTMPGRLEDAVVQRRLVSKKGAKRVLGGSFSVQLPR